MASDLKAHSLFDISLTQIYGEGKSTPLQGNEGSEKTSQTLLSALGESLGCGSLTTVEAVCVCLCREGGEGRKICLWEKISVFP